MNEPERSIEAQAAETGANLHAQLNALLQERALIEWKPMIETLIVVIDVLLDAYRKLAHSEARRAALLAEYDDLRPKPGSFSPRELLTIHSRCRLKLIQFVACEDRESALIRATSAKLDVFVDLAEDLFRSPVAVPPWLVPQVSFFLSAAQINTLRAKCPQVTWPSPSTEQSK